MQSRAREQSSCLLQDLFCAFSFGLWLPGASAEADGVWVQDPGGSRGQLLGAPWVGPGDPVPPWKLSSTGPGACSGFPEAWVEV